MVLGEDVVNDESYKLMEYFYGKYIRGRKNLSVCDVGSYNVNGTFKPIFSKHKYTGLDIIKGQNVDIVSEQEYRYPFGDRTFQVVISGATIEHVKDIFKWIVELKRIMKKNGTLCIIGPSKYQQHRYPVDCWRVYPDGMQFLLGEVARLDVLEVRKVRKGQMCMGVGRKFD